jgi:hypothetical protein
MIETGRAATGPVSPLRNLASSEAVAGGGAVSGTAAAVGVVAGGRTDRDRLRIIHRTALTLDGIKNEKGRAVQAQHCLHPAAPGGENNRSGTTHCADVANHNRIFNRVELLTIEPTDLLVLLASFVQETRIQPRKGIIACLDVLTNQLTDSSAPFEVRDMTPENEVERLGQAGHAPMTQRIAEMKGFGPNAMRNAFNEELPRVSLIKMFFARLLDQNRQHFVAFVPIQSDTIIGNAQTQNNEFTNSSKRLCQAFIPPKDCALSEGQGSITFVE